jgi:hypothetical protein
MGPEGALMLKVFTDFNAMTPDDICWILVYRGVALKDQIESLGLTNGDKIVLFQDEHDFEVLAALDYRFVTILGHETWVACPDWSTLVRK